MPTILDFHLRPTAKESYSLEVFTRGQTPPLATASFDYPLSFMTEFEMSRLDFDGKDPMGRLERLKAFGAKLYSKLFTPEVQQVWQAHLDRTDFLILCLRIAPEAGGLESLPWETLHDGQDFIAAGAKTGLSRLPLDVAPQDNLPALTWPLKMLGFVASPLDLADNGRLDIEREQEILLQAVNTPAGQGWLQVDFEDEAKLTILENSLETPYHILHFTGHGISPTEGGGLLLEDAQGKRRPATVAEILQALQKGQPALRLVVISGCQTARTLHVAGFRDLARGLIRQKIPAVIAMQFSISDRAGLQLAETLYPRLATGQPLEMALSATRRVLLQNESPYIQADALAPVLITANGQCLHATEAVAPESSAEPKIDFSFHLPLPQLSFGFYGRRNKYRQIRDGLVHQHHRAVIVHGIGGIGKTALISHAANRLRRHFRGVYAFDCSSSTLAPERVVLELHRYFERQGVKALQPLVHNPLPPEDLANYLAQVLSQWPLLLIFDNIESQLEPVDGGFRIANENLRAFISTLVKATADKSRFLFTSRYLFDLDAKRLGTIQELPLGDLSRPEVLGLMQKLPHLAAASYQEKLAAFETFGGHPYALVALDRHCGYRSLSQALEDARPLHAELREFLAIELNYARLSERSRELLNRLAAFREPVPSEAADWVMGEKVSVAEESLQKLRDQLSQELKELGDATLLEMLDQALPEQRRADDLIGPIKELVNWGLLTPVIEDGHLEALAVHSLVRDFCRDKQKGEPWRTRLRDAAAFYTNQTNLLQQDEKSPAAVWSEMEAFELLMEAGDFREAAQLLVDAHPLLDRWGFGRYLESQYLRLLGKVERGDLAAVIHNYGVLLQARGEYEAALQQYERSLKIAEELGDRAGVARSLHQIGMIHQARGEYEAALQQYERSLKIAEELGDRAGVARSRGQIGQLFTQLGRYPEAFGHFLFALVTFVDLQSPDARIVVNMLKDLRAKWGKKQFDAAWQQATGEAVPEGLID
jgi:CHAT domain-containing protein/tetratricopeptide (TPR) repeat protein